MHNINAGFTLVELMVTVAIVGILASIALPSYRDYVTRGRIPEALGTLAAKRVQLEQFFLDNRTYVGAPACTAASSSYFAFSCTTQTATAYTLQAAGQGAMAGFTYTINQNNVKATTAVPSGWSTSTTCWVTKKGGVC